MDNTTEATSSVVSPASSATSVETATASTEAPMEQPTETVEAPSETPSVPVEPPAEGTLFTKLQDEAKEEEPAPVEPPAPEANESKPEGEEPAEVTEEPKDTEEQQEAAPSPFKLKRADLRQFEQEFLVPFRDPEADVMGAVEALYNFNPVRTQAMIASLMQVNAASYPNEWLAAITGVEGLTVEQVTKALERPEGSSIAPEQTNLEFAEEIKELTDIYGDEWKNPDNDWQMPEDSQRLASVIRKSLDAQAKAKQEKDEKVAALEGRLAELEPQISEIKSARELAFENDVNDEYTKSVKEYREAIETTAFPVIFKERGLEVSENDVEEVKGVKEAVTAAFKPPYDKFNSDFDMFATYEFSQKDEFAKALKRVDSYKRDAALKQVQSKNETDKAKAAQLASEAVALNRQAEMEQDTIAVWTQKAATEFLETPRMSSMTKLLEANADLQRRLALVTDRPELIGAAATAANGNSFQDVVKARLKETDGEATGFLAERLAGVNR